jgi:hypothetical protein
MAALFAWIGQVLVACSGPPNSFTGSDRNGVNCCGRLWWMLKWAGHDAAAALGRGHHPVAPDFRQA